MNSKETVLISGADGFLGFHLLKTLSQEYNIIGIERSCHQYKRLNLKLLPKGIEIFQPDQISQVFKSRHIDFVVHTATHHAKDYKSYDEVFSTNVEFGLQLLHYATASNTKCFLNMDTVLSKNTNLYSFTKTIFRETLEFLSSNSCMRIINIKMDMIYGYNAGNHNFIQQMLEKLRLNTEVIELTKGIQKRSFLYIEDIVLALHTILQKHKTLPDIPFILLYLTHPTLNTIQEVMLTLKKITNSSSKLNFGSLPYRQNEIMETPTDNSMRDLLNWHPKYTLEDGLIETNNTISQASF